MSGKKPSCPLARTIGLATTSQQRCGHNTHKIQARKWSPRDSPRSRTRSSFLWPPGGKRRDRTWRKRPSRLDVRRCKCRMGGRDAVPVPGTPASRTAAPSNCHCHQCVRDSGGTDARRRRHVSVLAVATPACRGRAVRTLGPVGRTLEGRVVRQRVSADLAPSGRQFDLAMQWCWPPQEMGELRFGAIWTRHPGHDTSSDSRITPTAGQRAELAGPGLDRHPPARARRHTRHADFLCPTSPTAAVEDLERLLQNGLLSRLHGRFSGGSIGGAGAFSSGIMMSNPQHDGPTGKNTLPCRIFLCVAGAGFYQNYQRR